ncbi:Crp/Fnr family transcriptional regulator [Ructibacterium gallinarum]|uniref:Crp/Fnr family transcriptional regulator n=1 Tax=Ructibacterium gallinarum TaxID=2779355 RepID=A0A9D5M825_9FIRM|nr:Crp/Fnr family transcriptional regulator [Ructibacterium gallinarum]MBE5041282.1 Crp/Fnr family transcriptional regulator [Ructibacterium gallinarum]
MKQYIDVLKNTKLFSGVSAEEIETMLRCLGATLHPYKKGEYVFRAGEHIPALMILVDGTLHIQKDNYWGHRSILGNVMVGEMFGEAYVSPDSDAILNDIVAMTNSQVMFFDIHRILSVCSSACKFHALTVKNLFFAVSEKNRKLVTKLGYLSSRTTREKLLTYLSDEAKRNNSSTFSIPFNRQQLADFLSVDRSAMSNELCKMRDDGLITFDRNLFTLK